VAQVTIIGEQAQTVSGRWDDGRLLVGTSDLPLLVGWTLKPEGLCRGDQCMPVRDLASVVTGDLIDLGAVASLLGRPIVTAALAVGQGADASAEPVVAVSALAFDAESRRAALTASEAPDFHLPDLEGVEHGLDEWAGQKKLLVTFSSWCGCRYDLPGWQALHDELKGDGFTALGVAIDNAPEDVTPWVDGIDFPVMIDANHVLTELYAISNVPTVVWIDENNRIVRPNALAFGSDIFADFTGVESGPHLEAVRRWVTEGEVPELDEASQQPIEDLSVDEVLARLHFRVAAELLRMDRPTEARDHFETASALAPYDWTVRRAAMPLVGEDPFGDHFLALYDEWKEAGMPYHGLSQQAAN
jgi:peroxiredoxin